MHIYSDLIGRSFEPVKEMRCRIVSQEQLIDMLSLMKHFILLDDIRLPIFKNGSLVKLVPLGGLKTYLGLIITIKRFKTDISIVTGFTVEDLPNVSTNDVNINWVLPTYLLTAVDKPEIELII